MRRAFVVRMAEMEMNTWDWSVLIRAWDAARAYRMQVDETEFGNEEINKVQRVFVDLSAILGRRDDADGEVGKSSHKLAEDQIHQREQRAGHNGCNECDDVERPAGAVGIAEDALESQLSGILVLGSEIQHEEHTMYPPRPPAGAASGTASPFPEAVLCLSSSAGGGCSVGREGPFSMATGDGVAEKRCGPVPGKKPSHMQWRPRAARGQQPEPVLSAGRTR